MAAKLTDSSSKYKLIGKNYPTPDLVAKVTGRAKYAEDYRADGMLFAKLLLSPMPHARVGRIDTRAALAVRRGDPRVDRGARDRTDRRRSGAVAVCRRSGRESAAEGRQRTDGRERLVSG